MGKFLKGSGGGGPKKGDSVGKGWDAVSLGIFSSF